MESPRPRTRVYIDGFNFYYAAFRRGAFADHKWLDLVRLRTHGKTAPMLA